MKHQRDYHKTDIHRRLITNLALNLAILYNDKDYDISEYDVQAFIALFLKKNLLNTAFKTHRESFGKFDCALAPRTEKSKNGKKDVENVKEEGKPVVLYELKTYLKLHENINVAGVGQVIISDFVKLKHGIYNRHKCENPEDKVRGYFILVFKNRDIEHKAPLSELFFVSEHLKDSKKYIKVEYAGDDNKAKSSKNKNQERYEAQTVKIRASTKVTVLGITAMSWEVKG